MSDEKKERGTNKYWPQAKKDAEIESQRERQVIAKLGQLGIAPKVEPRD